MIRRAALTLSVFLLLAIAAVAQRPEDIFEGKRVVAQEVLVRLKAGTAPLGVIAAADAADAKQTRHILKIRSRGHSVAKLMELLSKRADVLYVEPNYIIQVEASTPNDPSFSQLWGLKNTGQSILGVSGKSGADISATLAWDLSKGGTQAVMGVVDTGVDYNHPDLTANIWSAPSDFTVNIAGTDVLCLAGTHGFNAINLTCNPMDDHNHGTHTSGTIGAQGNNATGVAGVNWQARIMGLKFLDAGGSGSLFDAISAIDFAIQAKQLLGGAGGSADVRVLSNSWGCQGCFSQALLDEINLAGTSNMLFVVAAGNNATNNDFTPFYPANYAAANLISVAATNNQDNLAWFSNFGAATVHLAAPGQDVLSTIRGGGYAYFSGTSMATPHVAGTGLLLLSLCDVDTAGLKNAILNNVDTKTSLTGKVIKNGRLNANRALRSCSFNLSANSVSFGNQVVDLNSPAKTVTVTNNLSTPVTISAITTTGDYAATSTCPGTMLSHTSCTVSLVMHPVALGSRPGTLSVSTNAPGSPHTTALSGIGVNVLTASSSSLSFSSQLVGTVSAAKTVTVTNNRSTAVTLVAPVATGDYQITTTCGATLASKATCQLVIRFAPTAVGSRPGSVSVAYDGPASPLIIKCTGTGFLPVSVTPASLTFSARSVGTASGSSLVTIKNNQSVTLNLTSMSVTGDFSQTATTCGASLLPGTSCTASINFKPTVGGNRIGTFTVTHDGPNSPQAVALSGVGTNPVTLSSNVAAFSNTTVGATSAPKSYTVTNKQSVPLGSIVISITGDFTQTNTCGTMLPALGSCTISVRFAPTALGLRSGTVNIVHDASNSPQTITLSGTGI